ncbi:MAG: hypothetical protein WCB18_02780 [Thermoplasmata archaeon]
MNALGWTLIGGALVAAAVAVQAGNNLQIAVPVAAAAVFLVAIVGVSLLQSRSHRLTTAREGVVRRPSRERVESDSLLRLRRSFGTGEIGRSAILATLRALERDLRPSGRTVLSLEAEREILRFPPERFRKWVDERLQRIEAAT